MKNIWESSETFEANATIEFCYWRLGKINEELNAPIAPINRLIDGATGFDPHTNLYKEIIELCESVIESKKILEADYSGDEKMLNATIDFLSKVGVKKDV